MNRFSAIVKHAVFFFILFYMPGPVTAGAAGTEPKLGDIPLQGRYAISAAIGRDQKAYHPRPGDGGPASDNPAQAFRTDFTPGGIKVRAGDRAWGLVPESWGYGQDQRPLGPAEPKAQGNRVEYCRGAITEWYVNGPFGLQQGFTLLKPPPGDRAKGKEFRLCLGMQGGLTARMDPDGRGMVVHGTDDCGELAPLFRYTGLTAFDAGGREAPARLEVEGDRLILAVDDRGLRYPLTIDPFVQRAKLTASDGAAEDCFGYSVAVSGDTLVVGAPSADSSKGSAYVFVNSGGVWTQAAKLTASDGAADDRFGVSVAVSGDTAVVGAPSADSSKGAAYVFVKPGTGWSGNLNEDAKLTASAGAGNERFGVSVAISGDTLVVGAYYDDSYQGSAYVFVKPGTGWLGDLNEDAKLTASDGAGNDYFGCSVAISGGTVVVGAHGANILVGSAYVFIKPGGGWSGDLNEDAKLTASDGREYDHFGWSVAIIGDTAVVGAIYDDVRHVEIPGSAYIIEDQGSAYVFVKPGTDWTDMTQTAKLTASDGAADDNFGYSVAISGDTVVVGAYGDDIGANFRQGSAYVFVEPDGGWVTTSLETAKLTTSDGVGDDWFGWSVAISGDAAVVGAYGDDIGVNQNQGSAYVFVRSWEIDVISAGPGNGTVTSDPAGIDCPGTCLHIFEAGETVTLTAVPDNLYVFGGWSGGGCAGTGDCIVTMDVSKTVIATFDAAPDVFELRVEKNGDGTGAVASNPAGIDCGGDCQALYARGREVTLTGVPDPGSALDGWSGGDCPGNGPCRITMYDASTVTATFNPDGDADGISDDVENGGPNSGDGNLDGALDANQPNVATFKDASGQYVTLVSLAGLEQVYSCLPFSPSEAPEDVSFPNGMFGFKLTGLVPGASTIVDLILHQKEERLTTFHKYGPTADNTADHWYSFDYDNSTGAEINQGEDRTVITLHLIDGGRGDADLAADGVIIDPGAPSIKTGDDGGGGGGGSGGGGGCFLGGFIR